MPTSYSDSYFATASAGPSRVSSARSQVGLSRSASSRIKEEDVRGDGVSSPDGSRKGKEKERKIRGLAASLGLDGVGKDVALSPGESLCGSQLTIRANQQPN